MKSDLLSGKVAIVTGGARDIGRAISLKLAEAGASVAVNYNRSEKQAEEVIKLINDMGGKAIAIKADVTKSQEVKILVEKVVAEFGPAIHILVNNAGGLVGRKRLEEMDEEFWHEVINLNLHSVFLVTRATLPYMPEGSSIINIASLAARDGGGFGAIAYATAKGGVLSFTRGLAKELGRRRIRVNSISPGLIGTTFHDTFTAPEVRQRVVQNTPLGREGTPEDVANVVLFLASDESCFITGADIAVNGGLYFI